MVQLSAILLAPLFLASFVSAALKDGRANGNMVPRPVVPRVEAVDPLVTHDGAALPPITTVYYFDQLIDHTKPSLGTFKQRYWHTWQFYQAGMSSFLMQ